MAPVRDGHRITAPPVKVSCRISATPVRDGRRISVALVRDGRRISVALVKDGCRISVAPVRDGRRISALSLTDGRRISALLVRDGCRICAALVSDGCKTFVAPVTFQLLWGIYFKRIGQLTNNYCTVLHIVSFVLFFSELAKCPQESLIFFKFIIYAVKIGIEKLSKPILENHKIVAKTIWINQFKFDGWV